MKAPAHWLGDRAHILWNSSFAQASAPADPQELTGRENASYTIGLPDAGFFVKKERAGCILVRTP
ncbi:MAG: hypothetical protein WCC21_17505 [Candidatus Acidiferrales bacterium]